VDEEMLYWNEVFHLMQYELIGGNLKSNVSLDDVVL